MGFSRTVGERVCCVRTPAVEYTNGGDESLFSWGVGGIGLTSGVEDLRDSTFSKGGLSGKRKEEELNRGIKWEATQRSLTPKSNFYKMGSGEGKWGGIKRGKRATGH